MAGALSLSLSLSPSSSSSLPSSNDSLPLLMSLLNQWKGGKVLLRYLPLHRQTEKVKMTHVTHFK